MTSAVRRLHARIVRQEHAADNVSQMRDARPVSEGDSEGEPEGSRVIDPGAYEDPGAALYVYRLRRGDQLHVGVVGDVSAGAFVDGRVRGHEAVQPDRVDALVQHFSSAAVRSELVALLHQSSPAVDAAIAETVSTDPVIEFTGPDDWEQTVWRVSEPASDVLCAELSDGVHYVADGHHRVAASLDVWHQGGLPADAGLMCVIYPLDGLSLLAFHRRIVGPVDPDKLFTVLSDAFELVDIVEPGDATGTFGLYVDGRWYDASYKGVRPPGAGGLDIAVLNEQVLEPLLGPGPLATPRLEFTSALTPLADLTKACDQDGGALFALRPPALEQLVEVADRGEVMPPKTTYFDPKPYAGIFLC